MAAFARAQGFIKKASKFNPLFLPSVGPVIKAVFQMDAEGERIRSEVTVRADRARKRDAELRRTVSPLVEAGRGRHESAIASQAKGSPVGSASALASRNSILRELPMQLKQIKLQRIGDKKLAQSEAILAIKESTIKQQSFFLDAVTSEDFGTFQMIL